MRYTSARIRSSMARPTSYREEYAKQARKLCLLGAIDRELADFFEVSQDTIDNWKKRHPEFSEALKQGKAMADANVAERLYQRAIGYSHDAVKIFGDPKTGDHLIVPFTKHYPPDTGAACFWLKNRAGWRDKQEVEHSGQIEGGVLVVPAETKAFDWGKAAERQQSLAAAKARAAGGNGKGNGDGRNGGQG